MTYRSNLEAPDLTPYFRHLQCRTLPGYAFGHDILSDWADKADDDPVFGLYKKCGFWSHDEAAILYNVVADGGDSWLDLGAHTGWTSAHIAAAGANVIAVEPMLWNPQFYRRFASNLFTLHGLVYDGVMPWAGLSNDFFAQRAGCPEPSFDGVVIDGDHDSPSPLNDARNAAARLNPGGVILFHDAIGGPVWEAIEYLLDNGFQCHVYLTPQIVACCWQNDAMAPTLHHIPDPAINWAEIKANHMKGFPWHRVTCDLIS